MKHHSPRILSIGQCQNDGPWMRRVLKKHLGAVVEEADSASEAVSKARQSRYDLILVNRELAFEQSSGLDLVPGLIAISPETPVMLVSDYEEAQVAAIEQGAARGFGKSDFETTETLGRLAKVVHSTAAIDADPPA